MATSLAMDPNFRIPKHHGEIRDCMKRVEDDDLSLKTFREIVQDKSIFFRFSAKQWDMATEDSYQLTDDQEITRDHADEIAELITLGSVLLEYGPGCTGKVLPIAAKIDKIHCWIGFDMHRPFLEDTIDLISQRVPRLRASGIEGLFGVFPDVLSKVQDPKLIVSFGSNLFNHPDPVEQLRPIASHMSPADLIYVSIDCHDPSEPGVEDMIRKAYSTQAYMHFIEHTLHHVEGYQPDQWELRPGLKVKPHSYCHSFDLTAKEDIYMRNGEFYPKGEKIEIFPSYKSSRANVEDVCAQLGLSVLRVFEKEGSGMTQFVIQKQRGGRL